MRPGVQRQPSLFDLDEVAVAPLDGLRRLALDETSWVDHRPGWLQGAGTVFDELYATGRFHQRWRTVWENTVLEPRLTAHWGVEDDGAGTPDVLRRLAAPLSEHYGIELDSVFVNLYRDGRDSVAWHRDRIGHSHAEPLVVTISLGARRRFLLRPRAGGRAVEVSVGALAG